MSGYGNVSILLLAVEIAAIVKEVLREPGNKECLGLAEYSVPI
jgi:hypothetical protein